MVNWRNNDTYSEAVRLRKQNPNIGIGTAMYGGVQNPFGTVLGQSLPSIFFSLLENYTPSETSGSSSSREKSPVDEAVAEQIKGEIDHILNSEWNNGAKSVDDLYANIEVFNNEIKENESFISQLNSDNATLSAENTALLNEIKTLESEPIFNQNDYSKIQLQINAKQRQIQANNEKIKENEKNIKTGNALIQQRTERIKAIQYDIKKLESLMKQLKKAEGRDAIEHLTNDETAEISNLIKKYRKADGEKKNKIEEELKNALQEYVNNPENTNITFINFARDNFNITKKDS